MDMASKLAMDSSIWVEKKQYLWGEAQAACCCQRWTMVVKLIVAFNVPLTVGGTSTSFGQTMFMPKEAPIYTR